MVKFLELEELLVEWLWEMYDDNTCVIDELIRGKAKNFRKPEPKQTRE